jgi:hypothetical protein
MEQYMDDYNSYKRYTNAKKCKCGCHAHCGHSCMTDDCDCTDCECESCLDGRGYN